jgi:hypothetical protein
MPTLPRKNGTGHRAASAKTFFGLVAFCLLSAPILSLPVRADEVPASRAASVEQFPHRAQFLGQAAPDDVHHVADWVADSADNGGLPFVIVDKQHAQVFVFDKDGRLIGRAWVLVGLTPGDDSVPGIGTLPLKAITPDMRTTPAGRFVAELGQDLGTLDVLWVDYGDAISLHRVINTDPAERRLERIVSDTPAEHRISYGCINVPAKFFDSVVDPLFKDTKGIVYILPEVKPMSSVFPDYYLVGNKSAEPTAGANSVNSAAIDDDLRSVEHHHLAGIVH